ncbi:hypothetical protein PG997_000805 [Apiospora hydei]|uniref:Uncharacterized protein n=1 Tax=Apiospora hydei TaxID=1337664 RepID=A0ABR1XBP8_9PEZI
MRNPKAALPTYNEPRRVVVPLCGGGELGQDLAVRDDGDEVDAGEQVAAPAGDGGLARGVEAVEHLVDEQITGAVGAAALAHEDEGEEEGEVDAFALAAAALGVREGRGDTERGAVEQARGGDTTLLLLLIVFLLLLFVIAVVVRRGISGGGAPRALLVVVIESGGEYDLRRQGVNLAEALLEHVCAEAYRRRRPRRRGGRRFCPPLGEGRVPERKELARLGQLLGHRAQCRILSRQIVARSQLGREPLAVNGGHLPLTLLALLQLLKHRPVHHIGLCMRGFLLPFPLNLLVSLSLVFGLFLNPFRLLGH